MKKLLVFTLIIVMMLLFVACAPTSDYTIAIVEGSLPNSFSIDGTIPETARIAVTSNGVTQQYAISADMVEGFDTSLSTFGEEKTMTIRYKDKTTTHTYTVLGEVNTKARLKASTTINGGDIIVTLSINNLTDTEGMLALLMDISTNSNLATLKSVESLVDGYLVEKTTEGNKTRLLYYNRAGDKRLTSNQDIMRLVYTKSNTAEIMLTIDGENSYIEMSEGNGTKLLPTMIIMI